MKPLNLKAAKSLARRYETITLREINEQYNYSRNVYAAAKKLTGFGSWGCTLCQAVNRSASNTECYDCIYGFPIGCTEFNNTSTYYAIAEAQSPKELHAAFRARGRHIRGILKQFEKE